MERIVIIGAGGLARETVEVIHAINASSMTWEIVGFLDDDPSLHGSELAAYPIIGPIDHALDLTDVNFLICTGRPDNNFSRKLIVDRLRLPAHRYATVVHPSARIAASAVIGHGTVVLAQTVATADVKIGNHVAIMPGVVLTHDDVIEDFATFGSGVCLGGRVRVSQGTYVGAGALVLQDVVIGPWALIGMGALILKDVPEREVWVGAPARYLRGVKLPHADRFGNGFGSETQRDE